MRTRFDQVTDDEIEAEVGCVSPDQKYSERDSDLRRIAHLAWWMFYMKAWIGWPVTFFESCGFHFDGHHRVRAAKFLARRRNFQVMIPVRYSPEIK